MTDKKDKMPWGVSGWKIVESDGDSLPFLPDLKFIEISVTPFKIPPELENELIESCDNEEQK